jgi:predicted transcriptional regulator
MARRTSGNGVNAGVAPGTLPDTELEVLACLWQSGAHGGATAREVRERIRGYRPMSHGAMATILKRLEGKGLVSKKKGPVGKAFLFEPTRAPEPMYRRIMRDLHERVFGRSGVTMMASLFETRPPTVAELDKLQDLLNELRRKHK